MSKKKVYGVGINDADYVTQKSETVSRVGEKQKQKLIWECPYYRRWVQVLARCYSERLKETYLSYIGCYAVDEWLTFSNFKSWMETQDWEGKELDKDLLVRGNKVYGPSSCVFVDKIVKTFTLESNASRGQYKIGVCWNNHREKFLSTCRNPFTKRQENLGHFDTEDEAHAAWLQRKTELAHILAAEQTDPRVAKALIDRYENYDSEKTSIR